jgi:hypothetical protein
VRESVNETEIPCERRNTNTGRKTERVGRGIEGRGKIKSYFPSHFSVMFYYKRFLSLQDTLLQFSIMGLKSLMWDDINLFSPGSTLQS